MLSFQSIIHYYIGMALLRTLVSREQQTKAQRSDTVHNLADIERTSSCVNMPNQHSIVSSVQCL